jgi:hypothetical protein
VTYVARERNEYDFGAKPFHSQHPGERDTVQFARSKIHARHQYADPGVGFDRIQRREGIFEFDGLDAGGAELKSRVTLSSCTTSTGTGIARCFRGHYGIPAQSSRPVNEASAKKPEQLGWRLDLQRPHGPNSPADSRRCVAGRAEK